LILLPGL